MIVMWHGYRDWANVKSTNLIVYYYSDKCKNKWQGRLDCKATVRDLVIRAKTRIMQKRFGRFTIFFHALFSARKVLSIWTIDRSRDIRRYFENLLHAYIYYIMLLYGCVYTYEQAHNIILYRYSPNTFWLW